MLHAGDFTYTGIDSEIIQFNEFLGKQSKFKHRIVIAGNHEMGLDEEIYKENYKINSNCDTPAHLKSLLTNCTYLEH